jgi:hypothetical protein
MPVPPASAHLGAPVIVVRYEDPSVSGRKRAGKIVDGPFIMTEGPHIGEWGADVFFWVNAKGTDPENADPVLVDGRPREGWGVKTGMDWRQNVLYDPTGLTPRSWHVWGEAEGEN